MKTQITKQNALIILEAAVKQELLTYKLEEVFNVDLPDWASAFSVLEPLFNIDLDSLESSKRMEYIDVFFDTVREPNLSIGNKAEKIYEKALSLALRDNKDCSCLCRS